MNDSTATSAATTTFFSASSTIAHERRTWAVIWLCGAMMALEIGGGAGCSARSR